MDTFHAVHTSPLGGRWRYLQVFIIGFVKIAPGVFPPEGSADLGIASEAGWRPAEDARNAASTIGPEFGARLSRTPLRHACGGSRRRAVGENYVLLSARATTKKKNTMYDAARRWRRRRRRATCG